MQLFQMQPQIQHVYQVHLLLHGDIIPQQHHDCFRINADAATQHVPSIDQELMFYVSYLSTEMDIHGGVGSGVPREGWHFEEKILNF